MQSRSCRRREFSPWIGKIPWRRIWQPPSVLLPGKSHAPRSLVGYSPWGCKESDKTEWLSMHWIWPEGLGAQWTPHSILVILTDGCNRCNVFVSFFVLELILSFPNLCVYFPSVTEIVGSKQRRIVGIVIQMFFTLGIIILPGIAYFIPNWQGIQLAITLPNFLFLLYYW